MGNRARTMAGMVMAGAILITPGAAAAADLTPPARTTGPHVRSHSPVILALIQQATERSATFRGLIQAIDASDGIVYVEEGTCGHGVRACFHSVTGKDHRLLWVLVNTRKDVDWNLMGSIGHELRHTIEVLDQPRVKNNADMWFFYQQNGYYGTDNAVETKTAVNAGNAVRQDVREFNRRANLD